MTYFNPKIYCLDNLTPEDQDRMRFFDYAVECVLNALDNINEYSENGDTLDQIRNEVGLEIKEELREWMVGEHTMTICSIMDGKDEYFEVQEKEDYKMPEWATPEEDVKDEC